jgi:hypothetical protein
VTIQEPTQVMPCCNLLSSLQTDEMQGCLFHKCNNCSCRTLPGISSYLTCQNEFRDTFPDSPVPNKSTLSRLVNRFRDTGSVQDRNRSGRPSVLSDDSLVDIRQTLLRAPRKSLRKLSLQSGLSYESVHKARKILKLHPYRVLVTHELKEPDKEKRLQYVRWFTYFIRGGTNILEKFSKVTKHGSTKVGTLKPKQQNMKC